MRLFSAKIGIGFVAALGAGTLLAASVLKARADSPDSNGYQLAPSSSHDEFCKNAKADPNYFKKLALDPQNQLTFDNVGGAAGGGVCWWHSKFQRAALYLAVYRPDLAKPSDDQAEDLIEKIDRRDSVTELPGYHNLSEFSKDWHDKIQKRLDGDQIKDGVFKFAWAAPAVGLVGRLFKGFDNDDSTDPSDLKQTMDHVYDVVHNHADIAFVTYFPEGVPGNHSLLIADIEKTQDKPGYAFRALDSDYTGSLDVGSYEAGANNAQLKYIDGTHEGFVPKSDADDELDDLRAQVADYCK